MALWCKHSSSVLHRFKKQQQKTTTCSSKQYLSFPALPYDLVFVLCSCDTFFPFSWGARRLLELSEIDVRWQSGELIFCCCWFLCSWCTSLMSSSSLEDDDQKKKADSSRQIASLCTLHKLTNHNWKRCGVMWWVKEAEKGGRASESEQTNAN